MDNSGPRKTVHDEPISSLHSSDAGEGKKMGEYLYIYIYLYDFRKRYLSQNRNHWLV